VESVTVITEKTDDNIKLDWNEPGETANTADDGLMSFFFFTACDGITTF
jgi:hypothetical protein